ncbi:sialoadhesin isoform X2 [Micropterus salmoides]|uniref:sialoadhesin isoform X2 n=1 Tax=Micropterus salmoides TaxID=27706 RepID=UPI0018ED3711|nr:sialoadhesin isoform X2 [Micropterus salmoides]
MGVGLAVVSLLIALMQGVCCKTWNVILPPKIVGISGSCVTVPCRFEVPINEDENISTCTDGVVWIKGKLLGPFVFTARSPDTNIIKGQHVGDLMKKNCTTIFYSFPKNYSDIYFFRLNCPKVKYSYTDGVNIAVEPGLPPPLLTSVNQVSEGVQVALQCSVPVPCSILPPTLIWLPRDNSRQEQTLMQQNVDGQMIMTSTLTFTASANHHNQSIACSVSYPLTKGGSTQPSATTQRLDVLYAPRFTVATLSTSGPVSEGRTVVFTCSSDANPPVSLYTWYRADTGKFKKKGEGEILVLQVSQKDSGVYLCEAQSQRGSERSRPVSLEINTTAVSSESFAVVPYSICGVVLVLYILTVAVNMYKFQSLSRRLKQIELKGEHIYTDLKACSVASDYDHLQF